MMLATNMLRWLHSARIVVIRKMKRILLCIFLFIMVTMLFTRNSREDLLVEYVPIKRHSNFSLILPHIEPRLAVEEKRLFMVVLVNSAATGLKHRHLRTAIRNTWGGISSSSLEKKKMWKLFFVLGVSESVENHAANLQEASHHNDIIIGNFTDHYYSLAIKTLMAHYWAVSRLSCKYVLKTDDDVYVRVPSVIQWLKEEGSPRPFYGGYVKTKYLEVSRDNTSKWYLTKEQYDKDTWPPYCHGAFHVISNDVIPKLLNFTQHKTPYFADDAYIGEILEMNLGVSASQIPGFGFESRRRTDCELISVKATGHRIDSDTMIKYHVFYQRYHKGNIEWKCSYWLYKNTINVISSFLR